MKQKLDQTNDIGPNVLSIGSPKVEYTSQNRFRSLVPFFFPLSFIPWEQPQIHPENGVQTELHNLEITEKTGEGHTIMPKKCSQQITKNKLYGRHRFPVPVLNNQETCAPPLSANNSPFLCRIFASTKLNLPFLSFYSSLESWKRFSQIWQTHRPNKNTRSNSSYSPLPPPPLFTPH